MTDFAGGMFDQQFSLDRLGYLAGPRLLSPDATLPSASRRFPQRAERTAQDRHCDRVLVGRSQVNRVLQDNGLVAETFVELPYCDYWMLVTATDATVR